MGKVRYTPTHEWIELNGDVGTVGITDRLSLEFGDIIYVELPEVGDEFEQDDPMGSIEFVNGETLIFHAPLSGEVIRVNQALDEDPDLLNRSPEGDGWICHMKVENPRDFAELMTREDYEIFDDEAIEDFTDYEEDEDLLDYNV